MQPTQTENHEGERGCQEKWRRQHGRVNRAPAPCYQLDGGRGADYIICLCPYDYTNVILFLFTPGFCIDYVENLNPLYCLSFPIAKFGHLLPWSILFNYFCGFQGMFTVLLNNSIIYHVACGMDCPLSCLPLLFLLGIPSSDDNTCYFLY